VADPYRWLEDGDDPEVVAWAVAQNARTRAVLDALPARPALRTQLERLLRAPIAGAPRLAGDRVFALERGGTRDQAVLTVRPFDDPGAPSRTLIDPAGGADDAAVAIDWYSPSPDGRLVAYGTSEGGDERSTLRVLDVDAGTHRSDVIPHCRAASVAWLPDGSAFAYTRYGYLGDDETEGDEYSRWIWWHVLGSDPTDDPLLWGEYDLPDRTAWPDVRMSPDGRWLLIHVSLGWSRTDVHLLERATGRRTAIVEGAQAVTSLEVVGDRLYGTTTVRAPRGRVVTASVHDPVGTWDTLVPEGEAVIEGAAVAGSSLLVAESEVAVGRVRRYGLDGSGGEVLPLPGPGSVGGLDGDADAARAVLAFESFARPASLWRWDPTGLHPFPTETGGVDPDAYAVEQVRYRSTDGTEVPMFLLRRAGTTPSPETPVVLTGYGGFAIAETPAWSPVGVAVADAGGLFAVAGIRGGTEFGEEWHREGMKDRKPQVFDDFAAAADHLVDHGLTSRGNLALRGGSNGGLLVGAVLTRRPDVARAVHCAVPLLDMVRYPQFLIARLWIPEYGDPDDPDDFAVLHGYSPYHRVVDGTCYPALLLTTADSDSRVDPCHARKFAARLQTATACGGEHPVLLRVEQRAGHGAGKPVPKQADEAADVLAFLFDQLGVDLAGSGSAGPAS
jgi:prolyl oligopeptidase